jgi:dihydrofolate reductase
MGALIQWNLISLDGYFEGAHSWALEWHNYAWGDELEEFSIEQLRTAAMLLFGRVTYEGMASYWKTAQGAVADLMNKLPKAVVSNSLKQADWINSRVLAGDPVKVVTDLKASVEGNIFVFGSGTLSSALLEAGLFDEYRLAIVPVVLGTGTTLFGRNLPLVAMHIKEVRPFATGAVFLRYVPRPNP